MDTIFNGVNALGVQSRSVGGISQADPAFREMLWDKYFMAAPRPRTPSEQRYSDRRLRSKTSPHRVLLR